MSWPDSLDYPVEEIEMVATYIVMGEDHDGPLTAWARRALADVADATAQRPLFGEAGPVEVGADWQPIQ